MVTSRAPNPPTHLRSLRHIVHHTPQIADPLYRRVRVAVMNARPGQHPAFEELRNRSQAAEGGGGAGPRAGHGS